MAVVVANVVVVVEDVVVEDAVGVVVCEVVGAIAIADVVGVVVDVVVPVVVLVEVWVVVPVEVTEVVGAVVDEVVGVDVIEVVAEVVGVVKSHTANPTSQSYVPVMNGGRLLGDKNTVWLVRGKGLKGFVRHAGRSRRRGLGGPGNTQCQHQRWWAGGGVRNAAGTPQSSHIWLAADWQGPLVESAQSAQFSSSTGSAHRMYGNAHGLQEVK